MRCPHAFWYDPNLPEAIEANHMMADFFVKKLSRKAPPLESQTGK